MAAERNALLLLVSLTAISAALVWVPRVYPQAAPATRPAATRPSTRPAQIDKTPAVNPHWSATECQRCHEMTANKARPIESAHVDVLCVQCHNGRSAAQEKHPVGRVIATSKVTVPPGWPTTDGKLACLTCHDMRITAGHAGRGTAGKNIRRPRDNSDFLRGPQPQEMLAFCALCHSDASRHEKLNPHHMRTPDGSVNEQSCLFCHQKPLKADDGENRTGDAALKRDTITLCLSCHNQHVDFFEPGHIGAKVPPEIKAQMVAAERAPAGAVVDAAAVQKALEESAEPRHLPLLGGEIVVCSTCHNPHERGIFPAGSLLDLGGIGFDKTAGGRPLRGFGKQLCGQCHGK